MGAVFKSGASYQITGFAALPERRFCVPAPESHRSVASLRRRKLCLFRFRASTKAHPARCSSSPQKVSRLFGGPCYREVISRSDGYSVVKDQGRANTPIFLGQRGGKIHPCCRKKYSVFLHDRISFTIYKNTPSFLNPLNKKTLIFLSRRIKNKTKKLDCSNVTKIFLDKRKSLFPIKRKRLLSSCELSEHQKTPWIQNDTVIPYHSDSHGAL